MATATTEPVHTTVVGVFDTLHNARRAIDDLRSHGFPDNRIGFLAARPADLVDPEETSDVVESAGVGAAIGAAAGGTAGLAVAFGLLTPIGPAIAGGALIAWLASLGAGAAAGAAIGGAASVIVPDEDRVWYEEELKAGRTIVLVHHADERSDEVRSILRDHDGTIREPSDVGTYGSGIAATPY